MRRGFVFFLILLWTGNLVAESCNESNCDQTNGKCVDGRCLCNTAAYFLSSEGCRIDWRTTHPQINSALIVLIAVSISLQGVILVASGVSLFLQLRRFHLTTPITTSAFWKKVKTQINIYTLIGLIYGAIFRILYFAINPLETRNNIPRPLSEILFALPAIGWYICGFLILLFWLQLMETVQSLKQEFKYGNKFRIAMTTLIVVIAVTLFISSIGGGFLDTFSFVQNAFNGLYCLLLIIFTFLWGGRYILFLRNSVKSELFGRETGAYYRKYMLQVVIALFGFASFLLVIILTVIVLLVTHDRLYYVILHIFLRFGETGACLSAYFAVWKRSPSKRATDSDDSQAPSRSTQTTLSASSFANLPSHNEQRDSLSVPDEVESVQTPVKV